MPRLPSRSLVLLAAGAALLGAAALAGAAADPREGGTLRYSPPGDVHSVDLAVAYTARLWPIRCLLVHPVFGFDIAAVCNK